MPAANTNISPDQRLIFALDFADPAEALGWVERLDQELSFFKVGLQLFLAGGWPLVEAILERGNQVMLDLKFFDIPATVARAMEQVAGRGVAYATIHGNEPIIQAAVAARGPVKVLAVTVLTSFDETDLRAMGLTGSIEDLVFARAKKALDLGCDGVVCSALEAQRLRSAFGDRFFVVTPGIRPGGGHEAAADDQKRIATARQAVARGADHVVVGRPIRTAADPLAVVRRIKQEIAAGLAERSGG